MKKLATISVFFLLSVFITPLHAYTLYGAGTSSCGEWTNIRKNGKHYNEAQWILGYVSSYGYYGKQQLKKVDSQALLSWMDNYCQKNPLKNINDSSIELIKALIIHK